MKKIYFTRFIKLLALIVPIVIICAAAEKILIKAEGYDQCRISDFYAERENSVDVVFLGASEIYTDYAPPYAYEKGGFTSYCYGVAGNSATIYKSQLKEILSRQSPQLIFVEPNGFIYDLETMDNFSAQLYLESSPLTLNKIDTMLKARPEDKVSAMFPILKHHRQFNTMYDVYDARGYNKPSHLKGVTTITELNTELPVYAAPEGTDGQNITPLSKECLIDFLEYCKSEGLNNIVFIRFPHKYIDEDGYIRACRANAVGEIAQRYGFEYLNLDRCIDDIGLDYTEDFYNPEHLSVYGQIKFTDYISNIITERYGLVPMAQSEANAARWEKSAKYIRAYFLLADEIIKSGDKQYLWETPEVLDKLDEILAAAPAEGLSLPTAK